MKRIIFCLWAAAPSPLFPQATATDMALNAPGIRGEIGSMTAYMLPGIPSELNARYGFHEQIPQLDPQEGIKASTLVRSLTSTGSTDSVDPAAGVLIYRRDNDGEGILSSHQARILYKDCRGEDPQALWREKKTDESAVFLGMKCSTSTAYGLLQYPIHVVVMFSNHKLRSIGFNKGDDQIVRIQVRSSRK